MPVRDRVCCEDIADIDRDRCVVHYTDGSVEQCFRFSQRYAKVNIASAHRAIRDVHIERQAGQTFAVTVFVSSAEAVEDLMDGVRAAEVHWLQPHVRIEYRVASW